MISLLLKYLTVFLSSTIKFVGGPIAGLATGLSWVETSLFTAMGMMATVLLFTLLGKPMRSLLQRTLWRKQKRFSRRNRRFVKIWRKWGIQGVSFLTPLLLSPLGGAILANAFGGRKKDIIIYMLISAIFWGFVISGFFYFVKELVV